jgi:hypothetical protein
MRRGDALTVLPSGRTSRVKSIVTWDGELEEAFAPMSVTVCLEDEIDISRGDMLVRSDDLPHAGRRFDATVVWMNQKPLAPNRPYLIKQATQIAQARIREIRARIDVNTLAHQPAGELALNEIGIVAVEAQRPLFFDPYRHNRATGSFILIDAITNETVGAGMVLQAHQATGPAGRVTQAERAAARGHGAMVIALEGGDPEVGWALERRLFDHGYAVHVIHEPEDLNQALRTSLEAGLLVIVTIQTSEDRDALRKVEDWVEYHPQAGPPEEAARLIWLDLEGSGRLGRSQGPLTGGAGI